MPYSTAALLALPRTRSVHGFSLIFIALIVIDLRRHFEHWPRKPAKSARSKRRIAAPFSHQNAALFVELFSDSLF